MLSSRRLLLVVTPSSSMRQLSMGHGSLIEPTFATASDIEKKYPKPLKTKQYGIDILHDPLWNKGMAFSTSERERLGLRGLLPPSVRTLEQQVKRCMTHLKEIKDPVLQNIYLQDLHNRNETLYHRVLVEDIEMIAPLVYTPTVGTVCQDFGHQFRRSRGMYFSREDRGFFSTMVHTLTLSLSPSTTCVNTFSCQYTL